MAPYPASRFAQLRVCLIYALSGLIGLGYQTVWYRVSVDRFGASSITFALVVLNFIGGLGAGALASDAFALRVRRWIGSANPLRIYGAIELAIAATVALTAISERLPGDIWGSFPYAIQGIYYQPTAAYRIGQTATMAALIFVPCFFMGTTFPLLAGAFSSDGRFPSRLYAWNTLGASAGILLCEFYFLQKLGHDQALNVLIAINAALGLACLVRGGAWPCDSNFEPSAPNSGAPASSSGALALAAIGGFLCGSIEGDMFQRIRYTGMHFAASMSFVAFWAILAIFAGSMIVRLAPRLRLIWIKIAMVEALAAYWLFERHAYEVLDALVHSKWMPSDLAVRLGDIGLFVFPAYALLSLLLPWLCNREQSEGRRIGRLYGINTAAFCLGILVFGSIATRVNNFYAFKLFIGVFATLSALTLALDEIRPPAAWKLATAGAAILLLAGFTSRDFDPSFFQKGSPPATYPARAVKSDGAHTTYVLAIPDGDRLYFDNHSMSGTNPSAQRYMRLMAHFPLLAQSDPKKALLICFGVGNTASAIAVHKSIERFDVVDLNDKVFDTAPEFSRWNHNVLLDTRIRLIHDDGRNYLNRTNERYDLITSEPPPPLNPGIYRLYSREYYASVIEHLTPGGLMTQWLPYEQMPQIAADLIERTFVQSFPYTMAFVGADTNVILVGGTRPIDTAMIEKNLLNASPRLQGEMNSIGVPAPYNLLARVTAGPKWLREKFGSGPVISDQRNDLMYVVFGYSNARVDVDTYGWWNAVVAYDPAAALAEIGADRLACGARLRLALTNLGVLTTAAPDIRPEMLRSIPKEDAKTVKYVGADWKKIIELNIAGNTESDLGNFSAALDRYNQSLAMVPDQVGILWLKARVLEQLGKKEEAIEALRLAASVDPDDPAPASEIKRIEAGAP